MIRWLIDPGHGGSRDVDGSSAFGVRRGGLIEKDLTLDIALRIRAELGASASLTRSDDRSLTSEQRTERSLLSQPEQFLSLHANDSQNPGVSGPEIWAHRDAGQHVLARISELARAFENKIDAPCPVYLGPLAALDPLRHQAKTTPCALELGYLSSSKDTAQLASPSGRQRYARAIAETISALPAQSRLPWASEARSEAQLSVAVANLRDGLEVWHEVPLVYQTTGMSCWAAAAAMIVGWRDLIDVDGEDVVHASGAWEAYREGLEPRDVEALAQAFDLLIEEPRFYSVQSLHQMLERYGPLWVGEASPGLHVVVVAGMRGDGTADGTWVYVVDPWPVGQGERYRLRFRELAANLSAVEALTGFRAQILHARSAVHRGR